MPVFLLATLLAGLLASFSGWVPASNVYDDIWEAWLDIISPWETWLGFVSPTQPLTRTTNNPAAVRWQDVLPKRSFYCNFWEAREVCEVAGRFEALPEDILLVTFPKTGTTMLQQLTHQLRSGGDMAFRDIHDVIPFVEVNPAYRGDARDVVQSSPRLFKTHQPLSVFSGGRRILLLRDPYTTFVSLYNFVKERGMPFARRNFVAWSIFQEAGISDVWVKRLVNRTAKSPEEYARSSIGWRREVMNRMSYYDFMTEFWLARHDPSVLLLCYEDFMGHDRKAWIRVVAKFMGVAASDNLTETVDHMSSKQFMEQHVEKFDESGIADEINRKNGAPNSDVPYSLASKVRTHYGLLDGEASIRRQLDAEWRARMHPLSGFERYDDMRRSWAAELRERHLDIFGKE